MNWQHLYLGLQGRISRRDFWIGMAGLVAAGIIVNLLPLIGGPMSIALIYPAAAVTAKRLHDFGRSAWLLLVPVCPAALAGLIAALATTSLDSPATIGAALAAIGVAALLSTVAVLVGLAFLVWAGTRQGQPGVNAHGQPMLGAPLLFNPRA